MYDMVEIRENYECVQTISTYSTNLIYLVTTLGIEIASK